MLRPGWLLALALASVVGWAVWLMPATVALSPINGVMLGPAPLHLSQIEGRVWNGSSRWRWQDKQGTLRWQVRWQGLRPGVLADLRGDMLLKGWLGAGSGIVLRDADAAVPLASLKGIVPDVSADGVVSVRGLSLHWQKNKASVSSGLVEYTGGTASWGRESATLPALRGQIVQNAGVTTLDVVTVEGQRVFQGSLENTMAELRVYRAWPALLGLSQGGSPDDVVFETSRQLDYQGP